MTQKSEDREGVMQLSHRLVAMHITGVAILVLVVLSSVFWVSAEHNKLALESSEDMVRAGVAGFRSRLRTLVKDYSVWDEAYQAVETDDREWLYSNIGNAAAEIGTLDMIVFVPHIGGTSFGWLPGSPREGVAAPLPPAQLASLRRMLETLDDDATAAGTLLADFEGEPWVFSIARVTPVSGIPENRSPASMPLQIHGQHLSSERLAAIGRTLLIDDLMLSDTPAAGEAEIPLRDVKGDVISWIVWQPPRPGASILRQVAPPLGLALVLILIVSAVSSNYAVRSARRLERALHDAKAADRSKTEFLSNVSHELRTPMNGILGVAQLLQTTRLDDEQTELVSVLFASAKAQMALISDLLDISRMEGGNRHLVSEPFEPASILKDLTEMIRVAADKKAIAVDSDWSALDGMTIRGDGRAFLQIMTNLLGNAVKFTDRGSVRLAVSVERHDDRARIVASVADTGRGIPPQAMQHIFERFYQVDGSLTRDIEGTGLGLAISQNLARLMGGRIEAASELGRGSTFSLLADFEVVDEGREARDAA